MHQYTGPESLMFPAAPIAPLIKVPQVAPGCCSDRTTDKSQGVQDVHYLHQSCRDVIEGTEEGRKNPGRGSGGRLGPQQGQRPGRGFRGRTPPENFWDVGY